MIEKDKISEIANKIVFGYNPEKIILFGSYASGNPNENSDLDLFVIKETDVPRPEKITISHLSYAKTLILINPVFCVYSGTGPDTSRPDRINNRISQGA